MVVDAADAHFRHAAHPGLLHRLAMRAKQMERPPPTGDTGSAAATHPVRQPGQLMVWAIEGDDMLGPASTGRRGRPPIRSAGSVERPKDVVRHMDEATRDRETFHRAGAARAGFRHTAHADVVGRPAARAEQWAGRSPPLPGRPLGVRASRAEAE